jgi:predicted metal-dependent HD superfamily phosphohydrolase
LQESPLRNAVVDLLCAAATHSTDAHKTDGMYGSEDLHFFLDIDMAVLGSNPEHYSEYTAKVRQEYTFLPETMYRSLRLKVSICWIKIFAPVIMAQQC